MPEEAEANRPSTAGPAEPAPEPKPSLWVLERADSLIREIVQAIWLSFASIWRVPRAIVAPNSITRLQALMADRKILPPRMNLFLASVVSALFLAWILPERTNHQAAGDLLTQLGTASAENWLLVAAPALVSLLVTIMSVGRLLGWIGHGSPTESTAALMYAVSSIAIAACIASALVLVYDGTLSSWIRGLSDLLIYAGFLVILAALAFAGWRCARQMLPASSRAGWRKGILVVVAPLAFVASWLIALVGTYWLVQAQALIGEALRPKEVAGNPHILSPSCDVTQKSLTCQALLTTESDSAIGTLQRVEIDWRDLTRSGQSTTKTFLPSKSQVTQLTPRVDTGVFWILRKADPLPLAFQVSASDTCQLYGDILAERRTLPEISSRDSSSLELSFSVYWKPGFGLGARKDAAIPSPNARGDSVTGDLDTMLAAACKADTSSN